LVCAGTRTGLRATYGVDEARRIVYVSRIRAVIGHPLADG
jgi:hypothetical protein